MTNRREVVLAFMAGSLSPLHVGAESTRKFCRVGFLSLYVPPERFAGMQAALLQLGYEPGRNAEWHHRYAEGKEQRLPGMVADLLARKVDLIVTLSNPETVEAMRATATTPIVMTLGSVPVESGLVASLARPGGNVTGTTTQGPETAGKVLELLRDVVPHARKMAYLWEPDFPGLELYRQAAERAGKAMGLQLTALTGRNTEEIDAALARLAKERHDALYVVTTGVMFVQRARVIEFAARQRLPAIYVGRQSVLDGGLMSYTADYAAMMLRTAAIVDRICQGAKPSEIPIEQPTRFDLVINLTTARAMGLTIPQSVLLRADELVR